jgi:hypothetical protein
MTTLREAAQQALEAWEYINKYGFVLADYEGPMEQAITALRAALEQPEPPPEAQTEAEKIAYCAGWWAAMEAKRGQKMRDAGYTRRPTLREMAEPVQEPEQEPVAYVDHADGSVIWKRARLPGGSLLYTAPPQPPQPAQEPKERWCSACGYVSTRCLGDEQSCVWNWSAIRAALPHRPSAPIIQPEIKADKEPRWLPMPWKGLTEEEHNYYKALGFVGVKAVEEKLRAKNSTLACIPAVPPV